MESTPSQAFATGSNRSTVEKLMEPPLPPNTYRRALRNPRLYVLGGKGGSINFSTVERFDPVANAWDGVDSMQSKRRQPAAAVLDGHLYVAGGYDSRDSPTATVESFNSTDCVWSEVPSMMTERAEHAMAVLPSGKP